MRFDTSNIRKDAKMYSVIGTKVSGSDKVDDLVQVGMVGKIGDRILDNVYEFLPLEATDKTNNGDIFFLATPEVDPDEENVLNNSLKYFKLSEGQIADAVQYIKHDKFAIEEDGIVKSSSDTITIGGYAYAEAGKRKLQYSTTKPSDYCMLAVIEDIVPVTEGMFVKQGTRTAKALTQQQMQYNIVRCRVID